MSSGEARRHHYVPKFLLRPWCIDNAEAIRAYQRVPRRGVVETKIRSLERVCSQMDLLMLRRHALGRDALERIFFGNVDDCGAKARERLPKQGPVLLTSEARSDWARLLLSIEARRPALVSRVKAEGSAFFREKLDEDPELQEALSHHGYNEPASLVAATELGVDLTDRALMVVQSLADDPRVGGRLVRALWYVRCLPCYCRNRLIISDRPLIRVHAFDSPGAVWLIPLSPRAIFIAAAHENNLARLLAIGSSQFCRLCNIQSARQAERFVFSIRNDEARWLEKHLPKIDMTY